MKKVVSMVVIAAMVFLMAGVGVFAEKLQTIKVTVNGNPVTFDQAPVNQNGMVLVPIRSILEAFGQKVTFDNASQTVTAVDSVIGMTTTVNLKSAEVKTEQGKVERSYQMDSAPVVLSGRTLIPVRSISDIFCRNVKWDQNTQTVAITDYDGKDLALSTSKVNDVYNGEFVHVSIQQDPSKDMVWQIAPIENVIWVGQDMSAGTANFVFKIELSKDADKDDSNNVMDRLTLNYVDSQGRALQKQDFALRISDPADSATPLIQNQTVNAKVGDYVKVTLIDNTASTGYAWYASAAPAGLEFMERVQQAKNQQTPGQQMVGSPLNTIFVYKVTKPGAMTLEFSNKRVWTDEADSTAIYTVNAL